MGPIRVLITNITLAGRTGTETYVRDLALGLRKRGHDPVIYSPELGPIARELSAAGLAVHSDLEAVGAPPDVIHAHHHPPAMQALLAFPRTPGIFVLHDRLSWYDEPPRFPRLRRYVAVDDNCRERLTGAGLPEKSLRVILNSVDLERFLPRAPLPAKPRRALVFSNAAGGRSHLKPVRKACSRAGLKLDLVGLAAGKSCSEPERILGDYDIVFAKARCALEALAVGCAVVLCDWRGAGPMVSTGDLETLRRLNFGMKTLRDPLDPGLLRERIGHYDAGDASEVSRRIRATAGLDLQLDSLVALYREVIDEHARNPGEAEEEIRAIGAYLRFVETQLRKGKKVLESRLLRAWDRVLDTPVLGPIARKLTGSRRRKK